MREIGEGDDERRRDQAGAQDCDRRARAVATTRAPIKDT